jgi:HEAT repeat protein
MLSAIALILFLQPPPESKLGDVLPRLQDKDAKIRLHAVKSLANWPSELEPKAIAALAKVIDDPDPRIRKVAIQTLGEIGPRAREWSGGPKFSAQLAKLFQDKDGPSKRAAVWAYGQVGIDTQEELQPLFDVLKSPSPDLRGLALASLAQYVHEETTAEMRAGILDRVADSLADKDARMQRLAAETVLKGGVDSVPGLIRVLDSGTGNSRLWAALVLGEIGPVANAAVPSLRKALNEASKDGRAVIQTALQKIGP